jgi:3-methyladenine DNA glycosylase AlkD
MSTSSRDKLLSEIRAYCAANTNPALAAKYARYFKEGYDAWGLLDNKHEIWTVKEPEWLDRYQALGLAGFLKLGEDLFPSGKYEEGALAIRFVKSYAAEVGPKTLPGLARWFAAGIANWAHTDVLCAEILSPALQHGRIKLADLEPWCASGYPYQRRAVPVAMLGLLKNPVEPHDLLEFITPFMADPERVVHQGTGWFLRELWKKKPAPVESFLLQWKNTAPRLIFQYATEKMSAEQRGRFKKEKVR